MMTVNEKLGIILGLATGKNKRLFNKSFNLLGAYIPLCEAEYTVQVAGRLILNTHYHFQP